MTDPHQRKNFITINEEFTCQNCGHKNPKAEKSCRNHCQSCLYSLHVDKSIPGDRKSACHGLMTPYKIEKSGKKGLIIYHKCQKCGEIKPNKALQDDNMDQIIKILSIPHE